MPERKLEVLFTSEGTYPVGRGGVSTWFDHLTRNITGVNYTVLTVMANPYLPARYPVPASVRAWIKVPLWGTEDPFEHLDFGLADLFARRQRTTPSVVKEQFLPQLARVLDNFWAPPQEQQNDLVSGLVSLHRLYMEYDYSLLMKDPAVWDWYKRAAIERYAPHFGVGLSLNDLVQSLGWIYRFFLVLATPVPATDVVHSSAAAFCALPGIVARSLRGTPFVLTEHGVYLREQYLNVGRAEMTPYLRQTLMGMTRAISQATYSSADVIAPVASFNTRWERELGASSNRIRVIYNGVDPASFHPHPRPAGSPPTVVSIARIAPVKDIATLLYAARAVLDRRPEVRFVVYGGVAVPEYYTQMLALRKRLGLEEQFVFAGHLENVAPAYMSGDVVALSSLSEGFPYAVIEAMMSERPVVATDVGGIPEALGNTGYLVPPRAPQAMAERILHLLDNPALGREMAAEARERALSLFTVDAFAANYGRLYQEVAEDGTAAIRKRLRLLLARVAALVAADELQGAIGLLRQAISAYADIRVRAFLLIELARVEARTQEHEAAHLNLQKAQALAALSGSEVA